MSFLDDAMTGAIRRIVPTDIPVLPSTPVWEVRPYTYTHRGVASLGYELVDDTGARRGIFDDVPTARLAANSRGADVRLSWAS